MRVATMFCWEYVNVAEAAEKSDWELTGTPSESGLVARLVTALREWAGIA